MFVTYKVEKKMHVVQIQTRNTMNNTAQRLYTGQVYESKNATTQHVYIQYG